MGFGFNLMFIFVLLPVSGVLFFLWITSQKKIFVQILGLIWLGVIGLIALVSILEMLSNENGIKKSKIYGQYVIDRTKFPGKQANWQYDNYRFEINKNNELIFNQTNRNNIIKSDTFEIEFVENYISDRIKFKLNSNRHHIINSNPTLYRKTWSFHYVFYSEKFGNVFFTKRKWKPIKQ